MYRRGGLVRHLCFAGVYASHAQSQYATAPLFAPPRARRESGARVAAVVATHAHSARHRSCYRGSPTYRAPWPRSGTTALRSTSPWRGRAACGCSCRAVHIDATRASAPSASTCVGGDAENNDSDEAFGCRASSSAPAVPAAEVIRADEIEFADAAEDELYVTTSEPMCDAARLTVPFNEPACSCRTTTTTTTTTTMHAPCSSSSSTTCSPASSSASAFASSSDGRAGRSTEARLPAAGCRVHGHYCDVTHVDPFARSRIVNFLRRNGETHSPLFELRQEEVWLNSNTSIRADCQKATRRTRHKDNEEQYGSTTVHVCAGSTEQQQQQDSEAEHTDMDHSTTPRSRQVYIATCRLVLPPPHALYTAEGMAERAKDAELLAAMHAERICNTLGIPLFSMPSTQRRYAAAVRGKERRYAPFPGDPVQPEGTPVPAPLRMLSSRVTPSHTSRVCVAEEARTAHAGERGPGVGRARRCNEAAAPSSDGAQGTTSRDRGQGDGSMERRETGRDGSCRTHTETVQAAVCGANATKDAGGLSGSVAIGVGSDGERRVHTSNESPAAAPSRTPPRSTVRTAHAQEEEEEEANKDGDDAIAPPASVLLARKGEAAWLAEFRAAVHYPWSRASSQAQQQQQQQQQQQHATCVGFDAAAAPNLCQWSSSHTNPAPSYPCHNDNGSSRSKCGLSSRVAGCSDKGARNEYTRLAASSSIALTSRSATAAQLFDPTESGMWQMVNTLSTRCSPAPHDALLLPYIYDPGALDRVTDYYLQHGLSLNSRVHYTHVNTAAAHTSARMYEATLTLAAPRSTTCARGKATQKQTALSLAAMHAELLLDALGEPLFPRDAERQRRHALAVRRFGRWAPWGGGAGTSKGGDDGTPHDRAASLVQDSRRGGHDDDDDGNRCMTDRSTIHGISNRDRDDTHRGTVDADGASVTCYIDDCLDEEDVESNGGYSHASGAPTLAHALPLPLKQQCGGDEVWLDGDALHRRSHPRSDGERIVAVHNDWNVLSNDMFCVHVDPAVGLQARRTLARWQRDVLGSPICALYVITRMGVDYCRATTITPLPRRYGIRGGNGLGRDSEQAMGLCAMHALDGLCALGIPVYESIEQQRLFEHERRQRGWVSCPGDVGGGGARRVCAFWPGLHRHESTARRGMPAAVGALSSSVKREKVQLSQTSAACSSSSSSSSSAVNTQDQPSASRGWGAVTTAPARAGEHVNEGKDATAEQRETTRSTTWFPYMPGYLADVLAPRFPPHVRDTTHILGLNIWTDFDVCTAGAVSDDALTRMGNDVKTCVQCYLRRCRSCAAGLLSSNRSTSDASHNVARTIPTNTMTRAVTSSVSRRGRSDAMRRMDEKIDRRARESWQVLARAQRDYVSPQFYVTGSGWQTSVHNIAFLRVPRPRRKAASTIPGNSGSSSCAERVGNDAAHDQSTMRTSPEKDEADCERKDGAADPAAFAGNRNRSRSKEKAMDVDELEAEALGLGRDYVLAVGVSLRRKDAERVCFLHAARLLHTLGEDVVAHYRVGLPRHGSAASCADVWRALRLSAIDADDAESEHEKAEEKSNAQTEQKTTLIHAKTEEDEGAGAHDRRAQVQLPRPLMHASFHAFLHSEHFKATVSHSAASREGGSRVRMF